MTAVEFLIEQLIKYELVPKETNVDNVIFHRAKEIEKKEIIDAWNNGDFGYYRTAEQYYNETYKNKINLVEIPREQLEKERNPNYKYFNINETTSQLPGINVNDVKPSNPQMVKENFSTKNK